jgi:hypothetical protein
MRRGRVNRVREMTASRAQAATRLKRLPQRGTRHKHERLLWALGDRRVKRVFY